MPYANKRSCNMDDEYDLFESGKRLDRSPIGPQLKTDRRLFGGGRPRIVVCSLEMEMGGRCAVWTGWHSISGILRNGGGLEIV